MKFIERLKQAWELGREIEKGLYVRTDSRDTLIVTYDGRRVRVYNELLPRNAMIIYHSVKEKREWLSPTDKGPLSEEQYSCVINAIANHFRKVGYKVDINGSTAARVGPPTEADILKMFPHYKKKGYKIEKQPDGSIKVSFPRMHGWLWNIIQVIVLLGAFILVAMLFLNYGIK